MFSVPSVINKLIHNFLAKDDTGKQCSPKKRNFVRIGTTGKEISHAHSCQIDQASNRQNRQKPSWKSSKKIVTKIE